MFLTGPSTGTFTACNFTGNKATDVSDPRATVRACSAVVSTWARAICLEGALYLLLPTMGDTEAGG